MHTPPGYDAEQATLFGDVFRSELFGVGAEKAEADGLLKDRAASADAVVPVRVVTVNRETRGRQNAYSVVFTPTEAALIGDVPSGPLSFEIAETSPVFGWLEGAGSRWVGTRLLLFVRTFTDGTHFFGAQDSPEVRQLVREAPRPHTVKP
ncbi:MAG: hypothetical protein QM756_43535 [Polyangiaceae bacterium]